LTRRAVGVELEAKIAERRAVAAERQAALAKKLAKLSDERQKLLSAFYANAIPLELLKDEQDRITTQERAATYELDIAESDLDGWQDVLRNCNQARRELPRGVPEGSTVRAPSIPGRAIICAKSNAWYLSPLAPSAGVASRRSLSRAC
jgi:hypothetical protein